MTKLKAVSTLVIASFTLTACGIFGGDGKYAPDEFEVVDRAPLVIPPESELRPPRPGEPRAQEIDPGRQAYEALFPGSKIKPAEEKSNGEKELLSKINASDPGIRSNVARKDIDVVRKRLILAEILEADERQFSPDNVQVTRVASNQSNGN